MFLRNVYCITPQTTEGLKVRNIFIAELTHATFAYSSGETMGRKEK
jgi:hypothetical protein